MVLVKYFSMIEELILTSDIRYWAREVGLGAIAEIYIYLEKAVISLIR